MPLSPTLNPDETNTAFVGLFEAYLASGSAPARGDDFPATTGAWPAAIDTTDLADGSWGQLAGDPGNPAASSQGLVEDAGLLPAAGHLLARSDFKASSGLYLGGLLGYVGGVDGTDTALPVPPAPDYGPIRPGAGAAGPAYPPALGTDPDGLPPAWLQAGPESFIQVACYLGTLTGFIGQADGAIGTPPAPTFPPTIRPWVRSLPAAPIDTFQGYLAAAADRLQFPAALPGDQLADLTSGPMGRNLQNDPAGSQAQLDGQFDVFAGQVQPPFTTSRLPRLTFGPFLNLTGLTYQIELDAFAKFGLAQIQYRLYANDQPTPPYNVLNLTGQSSFSTDLIGTLDSPAATFRADALLTDSFGNVASQSALLPGVPDTTPPTAPPFLYVVQVPSGPWLFVWGPATDDFLVDHYQIDQVDPVGDVITTLATDIKSNYFLQSASAAGNSYRVRAFDLAGNVSPSSPIAQAVAATVATVVPQITEVLAEQLPGSQTITVSWSVTPPGTACSVMLVDALEHPIGTPAVSSTGQATLTVPTTSAAGLYRVKVTAA